MPSTSWAPPRRAGAPGRASASTRAATRPTAPRGPASSSASAASSARRRAVPGASAVSASSPSSTKRLARELFGAPKIVAGHRRRFSQGSAFSHEAFCSGGRTTGRAATAMVERAVADAARSACRVRRSLRVPRAATGARRIQSAASCTYYSTRNVFGPYAVCHASTQSCSGSSSPCCVAALLAGCGSDDPESAAPAPPSRRPRWPAPPRRSRSCTPRPTSCSAAGRRVRAAPRRAEGLPGGGEQVGLVVRALPGRVPVLPEPGDQERGKKVAFLGVDANDNDADAAGVPRASSRCRFPQLQGPRPRGVGADQGRGGLSRPRRSTTPRASWPTCKQGGYATEEKLAEDIERYAR